MNEPSLTTVDVDQPCLLLVSWLDSAGSYRDTHTLLQRRRLGNYNDQPIDSLGEPPVFCHSNLLHKCPL